MLKVSVNKEILLVEKNIIIVVIILVGIVLKMLKIIGNSILMKILYLVFFVGFCNEVYFGIVWDLMVVGDMRVFGFIYWFGDY